MARAATAKLPRTMTNAELDQRGWNWQLRWLHLPETAHRPRHDREQVAKAERTAAWKRDAARVASDLPVLVTSAELQKRGWTRSMVTSLLGSPAYVAHLDRQGKRVRFYYRAADAEAHEAAVAFTERKAAGDRRSQVGKAAAQRRADEVHARVRERLPELTVDAPRSYSALVKQALRSKQAHYDSTGRDASTEGADQVTIDRWCENYLRHECSPYEEFLEETAAEFAGVPGVGEIYHEIVRPEIDRLVSEVLTRLKRGAGR